jgi:O-succinylbenzoic acid--CoA ligase
LLDAGAPLAELSAVLVGGAPTPERLLDRALAAGVPVHPTYGLTEAASQVATARPAGARDHPRSVGQPLYGVRVTVVADGSPVETGERGEIVIAGPTVTPGYLDAGVTETAIGEWGVHTGDVGVREETGRLRVLGRRDEMVLTGGELVAPREVVETLRSHPVVADATVVGLPDEEWGERVAALVVPEGDTPDVETIRTHCRDSLPGYKCPKTVAFADALPRTVSGTVDREVVRARLRSA